MPDHTIHTTDADQRECPRYHPPATAVPDGQRWNCQSWDGLGRMELAGSGVPVPDMDHVAEAVAQIRGGRRPTFEQGAALVDRVEQLEATMRVMASDHQFVVVNEHGTDWCWLTSLSEVESPPWSAWPHGWGNPSVVDLGDAR